jgi:glycogen synthase
MKILLCSHVFAPSIGGIETVSAILADQFSRLGCAVTVVTNTPGGRVSAVYQVVRRPSLMQLYQLGRGADVIFENNISLKTFLPLLFSRRPIVVTHQTFVSNVKGGRGWTEHLKLGLLRFCRNTAISKAVARSLPVSSVVIGNPFEADEFNETGSARRSKDIVFLGRLVSDKGCDLVLRALAILKAGRIRPSLTIIGDGPEMSTLKQFTSEFELSDQVTFRGALREGRGREVAEHKIMVVPSTWEEPFGVVALEGIAAGCVVVASRAGGLPEAVGPCGVLFKKGDVQALASTLKELLLDSALREKLIGERKRHLAQFQPEVVAGRYKELFEKALHP